jgi:hypothetical protein
MSVAACAGAAKAVSAQAPAASMLSVRFIVVLPDNDFGRIVFCRDAT